MGFNLFNPIGLGVLGKFTDTGTSGGLLLFLGILLTDTTLNSVAYTDGVNWSSLTDINTWDEYIH